MSKYTTVDARLRGLSGVVSKGQPHMQHLRSRWLKWIYTAGAIFNTLNTLGAAIVSAERILALGGALS
jgi:hypothetical protein